MINHVRTLLLNRGRDGTRYDSPGEEFVPLTFVRKKLPPHLVRLHETLFGRQPDRLFLNYRARQLMMVLHATELAEYITRKDGRLTYYPFLSTDLFSTAFIPDAVQFAGAECPLYISGEFTADEGLGLAQQVYRVEILPDNLVQIVRQRPSRSETEISYSLASGLSLPIALPGSSLTIRFRTPAVGTAWRVSVAGKPSSDIGQLLARLETSLGDGGVLQLFPPPYREPVQTYKQVWEEHPHFLARFSALLLAAVEQIDAAPQEQ